MKKTTCLSQPKLCTLWSTLQKCCVIFYTTFYSTLFNYAIEQLLSSAVHNIVVKYIYTGVVQNFTNSCFIILINDWLIINKQALINSAMTIVVSTDQLLQIIIFHQLLFENYMLHRSHLINKYTIKCGSLTVDEISIVLKVG